MMNETCMISVLAGWGSPIPNASVLKLRIEIDGMLGVTTADSHARPAVRRRLVPGTL